MELLNRENLAQLLPATAGELRESALTLPDLLDAYEAVNERMLKDIDLHMDLLAVDARWNVDLFNHGVRDRREASGAPGEQEDGFCRIATRVVYRDSTLSIQWLRNRYVKQKSGPSKVYSTYIRKGTGFSYSMASFKREPKWVQDLVEVTEQRNALIRERVASLTTLRRELRKIERRFSDWDI